MEEIFAVLDQLKAASEKVQTKIVDINKRAGTTRRARSRQPVPDLQIALLNNEKYYGSMAGWWSGCTTTWCGSTRRS